jgi:hypothetical protein
MVNGVQLGLDYGFGYMNQPIDKNVIFVSDGNYFKV